MTRVIVDASVLTAALMADGTARHALLHSREVEFVIPAFIFGEVAKNMERIVSRTGLPREIVAALMDDLRAKVEVVPRGTYSEELDGARTTAKRAGASGDEEYVALALTLESPIWTYDKDFLRIPGVRLLTTGEVEKLEPRV